MAAMASITAMAATAGPPATGAGDQAAAAVPAVGARPGAAEDPALWPEAQREFYQDGPGLLLTAEQRAALAAFDPAGRERFIREFFERPEGGTAPVELREGITRRQRLAAEEFLSPADVRAQLLFLNGRPAERVILDCGTAFKPIEVWTWLQAVNAGAAPLTGSMVVYRPVDNEPFRAWTPDQSKRVLYTSEMEYWLEQWEELRGRGAGLRFDIQVCKQARLVDHATGIEGLTGARKEAAETSGRRALFGTRPWGAAGEGFLDAPGDLAAWARQAAITELPAEPARLPVPSLELQFPERAGQRILTRVLVQVVPSGRLEGDAAKAAAAPAPSAGLSPGAPQSVAGQTPGSVPATGGASAATPATPIASLTVEGTIDGEGRVFETFRTRFRVPAPVAGQPVGLALDHPLRPERAFVLRLRIKDDASGAEARIARGFVVPARPVAPPAPRIPAVAAADQPAAQRLPSRSGDSLTLMPPEDDVVLGLWRAEALVTGERIAKVVFLLDGKQQLARNHRPYTVEVRLARFPVEQVVRAEGFDADGQLVAADQVILNQPRGGLTVAILEPARGGKLAGKVMAKAEVTVPQERRVEAVEFRLNDKLAAKLTAPPWQTQVEIPGGEDTVYLTVAAQLDDGSRAEDVRFLRSPQFVEEVAVNLIELYTAVSDRTGQPVRGLGAGDFEVLEGGQPQTISRFELVENLPLTLGILIDTSGSMASSLGEAQRAAGSFLERIVRKGDRCFTLTFSDHPVLRMPLTDDARAAVQSLERLQAVGATSIHDALVHSLYYFRGTRGQRALVLLSDGDDNSSQLTYDESLEYAKRSGVSIYTIGLNISAASLGIRGKLNRLSELTGGKVFYVHRADELATVYAEIERELRSRYLLAFQSGRAAGAGGFRQVEVKVRKPGLKARTARGYYP